MIRVLQCVNNMHRAGLETVLMNYYRHMDRSKIQFDFLVHRAERDEYDDEIEALGGKIYHAPRLYPQNYPAYFAYMKAFFAGHPEYRIIHSHIDAMSYLPLLAAKKAGIPVRIAHSHNTSIDRDIKYPVKQFFRFLLPKVATHLWACGDAAGKFLYRGRDFCLIPNAVETEKFCFSQETRVCKRRELGIENQFVVGHVGRFTYQKNHLLLLDIFAELLKKKPDSVLLLAGRGEKENEVRRRAREMGIEQKVLFLGSRSDTAQLYQAMDVFVLPSLFEGVPVVGIEAQSAGLPCFFSHMVPTEVAFSTRCSFIDLSQPAAVWAQEIISARSTARDSECFRNHPYDIDTAQQKLTDYYLQLDRQCK